MLNALYDLIVNTIGLDVIWIVVTLGLVGSTVGIRRTSNRNSNRSQRPFHAAMNSY
jgi:hypothetical protein